MGYKKGEFVIYNDQNWVVNDIIPATQVDGVFDMLLIKNIITFEELKVPTNEVKEFVVVSRNKTKTNNNDTEFINDLFKQGTNIKDAYESTELEVFADNTTIEVSVDDIEIEKFENSEELSDSVSETTLSKTTNNVDQSSISQTWNESQTNDDFEINLTVENTTKSFEVPKNNQNPNLTADDFGFGEVGVVDETISDLPTFGVMNTYEFIPSRMKDKTVTNTTVSLDLNSKLPDNPILDREITTEINLNEIQRKEIRPMVLKAPIGGESFDDSALNTQDLGFLMNSEVKNTKPNSISKTHAEQNLNDSELEVTQTEKMMLNGITNTYASKTDAASNTLGPINTRRLIQDYEKQKDLGSKSLIDEDDEEGLTGLILEQSALAKRKALKGSKAYRSFKKNTTGLILVFVLMLIFPLIGIFTKLIGFWLTTDNFSGAVIGEIFLGQGMSKEIIALVIGDIFLVVLTPIFGLIFLIYLVTFVISMNNSHYQKIDDLARADKAKNKIIDGIQDYNSQTSRYFVKIHNDIKETKKQVQDLNGNVEPERDDSTQNINIAH